MLGTETGIAPEKVVITDLVVALLHLDERAGCCEQAVKLLREDLELRRILAARLYRPELRRLQHVVDFDDPNLRQLNAAEFHQIDSSLAGRLLPISRTGRQTLNYVEIYPGRGLSIAEQLKLIGLLGLRPPCWIGARAVLNDLLKGAAYPIMALCGAGQALTDAADKVAGILQVEAGRMLREVRLTDRWDQRYRFLAEEM